MRANGEGSVYRRGSGWEAAVTYNGRRRTARAATPTAARAKLRELLKRAEEHEFVQDERLTVDKYLEYWTAIRDVAIYRLAKNEGYGYARIGQRRG